MKIIITQDKASKTWPEWLLLSVNTPTKTDPNNNIYTSVFKLLDKVDPDGSATAKSVA